ncbi:TIGR02206 family membrane protein [Halalkalibacter kiskunsagensis]|uniref:TIGR02206 family membrane protein n=1 Tax=Halalkalibacter kiskunsagensis TaxID=1548599 RepID=A0ABV6KH52_9BACI
MNSIFELDKFVDDSLFLSFRHIVTLILFLFLIILLYTLRQYYQIKKYGRWTLFFSLAFSEISLLLWSSSVDQWHIRYNLPLHLCTISLYLSMYMLAFKSYFVFEVVYFFGIGGALQAIITPDLFYTFPHFRFFHFFIAHFAIILASLYMVWVEKFTVTLKSIIKSMLVLNTFAIIAFFINKVTGANYMFLSRKPPNISILDYLGPYPWYIFSLELVALLMFLLLYLPFFIKKKLAKKVKTF